MKKRMNLAKLSQNDLSNAKGGYIDVTAPTVTGPTTITDPGVGTITIGEPTILCVCGCWYADQGGSSDDANGSANMQGGLISIPPK